ASVLTLAYFLVLERNIFFVKIETPLEDKRGAPLGIKFSEILLTAITVGVGLGFPFVFNTWILPIKEMLR
ncbi:MAG: NADH-quinone oxidoreductase subunit L, partial [Candidatus Omnitrophica bacterium]|nr:NADH-quinone oxidoreductase subunit L [Candidatus Omnitrophota bacterium]